MSLLCVQSLRLKRPILSNLTLQIQARQHCLFEAVATLSPWLKKRVYNSMILKTVKFRQQKTHQP
nr:MAG TPA: hypothetical protein [Caudoviricetes sp.]